MNEDGTGKRGRGREMEKIVVEGKRERCDGAKD